MARVTPRDDQTRDEVWRRRASSFGGQAAAYAEHRLDYAPAAVAWALEPVAGRAPLRVLDLGAGTGKLTGVLAALAGEGPPGRLGVVAVEPDPDMLAQLRRAVPGVRSLAGAAEDIPLPAASVDAVLCGQAAHWFDMDATVPQIARVLTPGGVFAGLWNIEDDREDWVAGLARVTELGAMRSGWHADTHDWPGPGVARTLFGPAAQAEFEHGQARTADSLAATIGTHSRQLVMDPAERELVLARVRDYLRARPETGSGEFRLPLVTEVLRSVKI